MNNLMFLKKNIIFFLKLFKHNILYLFLKLDSENKIIEYLNNKFIFNNYITGYTRVIVPVLINVTEINILKILLK